MKRLLCAIFALMLALSVPVSAYASGLVQYTELLEFDSVDSLGNVFYCNTSKTIQLDCPTYSQLKYIDLTFRLGQSVDVSSVSVSYNGGSYALTVTRIESDLYRAYGSLAGYYESVHLAFKTASAVYITLESVKVLGGAPTAYTCEVDVRFTNHNGTADYATSYNITTPAEAITSTSVSLAYEWQSQVRVYDWQKYDKLVIWGSCTNGSIVSIRASLGTAIPLPCTVSYFDAASSGSFIDTDVGSVNYYGKYLYMVEIDLASLDREDGREIRVYFTGSYANHVGMTFNCQYVNGYVIEADTSGAGWWNRFTAFFTNLFGSDKNGESQDYAEDMEQQATEIQDAGDYLDGMFEQTPPGHASNIVGGVQDYIDPSGVQSVGFMFAQFFDNSLIMSMVMISMLFALAAYVIYGRR